MEALPRILESMQLTMVAITALVAFGFSITTVMLFRQSTMLREIGRIARDVSKEVADVSKLIAEAQRLLVDTHALTAKAAAALENVSRLVVHPGGKKD